MDRQFTGDAERPLGQKRILNSPAGVVRAEMPGSVYIQVLARAAEILGGMSALCSWLLVSMDELDAWMHGTTRPPGHVFVKLVDLVSTEADSGKPDVLHRSTELRRKSALLTWAARATRDHSDEVARRALAALDRSVQVHASILERAGSRPLTADSRNISVHDFTGAWFAPSDGPGILEGALNAAVNATAAARANVQLLWPEGLRIVAHLGFDQRFLEFFAVVSHDTSSACGRALERGQRVVVNDVLADSGFAATAAADVMRNAGARACQSTPIFGGLGQVIGMLSTHYERPHQPAVEELAAIDRITLRTSFLLAGGAP